MTTVRELHQRAMALAQEAFVLRETGEIERARQLASEALPFEIAAAELVEKARSSEPTRSILYRSASSLAFQTGDYETAQRLSAEGLAGYPPPTVELELKELLDQINFERHLAVEGDPLKASEMQLSLTGDEVGIGRITWSAFEEYLQTLISMVKRSSRRLVGEPYRSRGRPSAAANSFTPLVSMPRAGSFAITVEVAQIGQYQASLAVTPETIIDDVVINTQLVNEGRLDELRLRIAEDGYFTNVIESARQLTPDGERVKFVGLTSSKHQVSLTHRVPEEDDHALAPGATETHYLVADFRSSIIGLLDQATSRGSDQVGLMTDDGRVYTLSVKEGLDDIVHRYFNRRVNVRVEYRQGELEIVGVTPIRALEP